MSKLNAVCIMPERPPTGRELVYGLFGMTVEELVQAIKRNEDGKYTDIVEQLKK